jgi:hypothetical protein
LLADRLDPVKIAVGVDERHHHFILALELLEPLSLRARQTRAPTQVALSLPHPAAQRFGRAADLGRNRADRRSLRVVPGLILQDQPNRPLPDFR